jgi:2-aminoadipate transaminase
MATIPLKLSAKAARTTDQPISFLMAEAVSNPELISLAAGMVDYESLPTNLSLESLERLLSDPRKGRAALQYGTTRGLDRLRQAVVDRFSKLERRSASELGASPDRCVITTGSQQGLYILTDVLIDPGDIVFTSAPTYFVYAGVLASLGAKVISVPIDAQGVRTDVLTGQLDALASRGELHRVRAIYCVSYFQNPTGVSLSLRRRREIVEIAQKYSTDQRIVVIEDAAYRELRYSGPDLPSIRSFDPNGEYVVYATTFSKAFAPGLKTGALLTPDDLTDPILHQKGNHDFGSCNLVQHLLACAIEDGGYERQVERVRASYAAKRDAMLEALERTMTDVFTEGVSWTHPDGGLYVWLRLPAGWDTRRGGELFQQSIEKGVLYVPGDYCYVPQADSPTPTNEIRLSFGVENPDRILEGVRRLGEAIRKANRKRQTFHTAAASPAR